MADRTTVGQRLSIPPRTARHACVWIIATPIKVGGRPAGSVGTCGATPGALLVERYFST
jgi:hypothetical protein